MEYALKKAYVAGWKACVESIQDQSFDPPDKFDQFERDLAEQCFYESKDPAQPELNSVEK